MALQPVPAPPRSSRSGDRNLDVLESNPHHRFRQKLEETNDLGEALRAVLADLFVLKIVTWVAEEGDTEPQPGHRLRTQIDLIDGDIENEIGVEFLEGREYASLRTFHEQQVFNGRDTISHNVHTLLQLAREAAQFLKENRNKP
ncbi:MAG: hypothetical protein ACUVSQ_03650 [Pseudanabaenaceae cyanobacterium]